MRLTLPGRHCLDGHLTIAVMAAFLSACASTQAGDYFVSVGDAPVSADPDSRMIQAQTQAGPVFRYLVRGLDGRAQVRVFDRDTPAAWSLIEPRLGDAALPIDRQLQIMAASFVTMLPCIILFFAAQRYFVQSTASSGLKG